MAINLSPCARFSFRDKAISSLCDPKFCTEIGLAWLDLQKCHLHLRNAERLDYRFPLSRITPLAYSFHMHSLYANGGIGGDEAIIAIAVTEDENRTLELKQALEDLIHSTERGLQANAETRSEIMELVGQLEAHNPHPKPLECLDVLDGKWILRYTSLSEFFPLLAAGSLPFIKLGEISQTIKANESLMVNCVVFIGPLGTTSLSANASFEICSPKRLQIKFEEGLVGAPQLDNVPGVPDSFTFLGQKVDLTAFQGIFQNLQSATNTIARTISGQPPLKFSIKNENAQPWLLTTYLDQDLRISRGDNGSVFVFVKDVSTALE
ncbi:hypothetical protein L7F22_017130 [Adiantum nelumboides]|nr:hypothetical protein [Adiantum nelumboides]